MSAILESFERHARDHAHDLALWSRSEHLQVSFAELATRVRRWRKVLPLRDGDVVALATGNAVCFVEIALALLGTSVPVALLDAGLAAEQKRALASRLGLTLLLHRDSELPGETICGARSLRLDTAPASVPAGTALIKLTSGSTGHPVGICLDHTQLAAGIDQIGRGMSICQSDHVLIAIPLSHSYGFDNGVLSLARLGTPLILEPGYYPASLQRALREGEATFFPAVPPMVRALGETEWPADLALRRVICAGGPLAPEFARAFLARSGRAVHQFYGSTETGGIAFEDAPEEPAAEGTVGRPLPGVAVELSEDGTVTVVSAANFLCYLGTAERGDRRVILGDRAEWTPEGRLRLIGRAADLLNVGGRRLSALAIESALRTLPGVIDAAVVGVSDAVRGDRVVGFIVGPADVATDLPLPAGLAARDLRLLPALPYTDRGKLDRGQLRRWASERT